MDRRAPSPTEIRSSAMTNLGELLQKGMTALRGGRLGAAERSFRKAVEIAPRHFGALNLLTVALTGLERFGEAEVFAERALRIDASSDATHYNYGTVLKHNNKLEQAIAAFDAALAINPRHVKALNNRGAAHSQLERYEEAIADFDRALALDRRNGDAYYNKANALAALKRRKEALRNYELALALNPRHASACANLLILFRDLGEYDKAVECGRRFLALEPDSAEVMLNLAAAELGRSRHDAALRWLGDLLAKSPDNIPGLKARARILIELELIDDARVDVARLEALTPQGEKEAAAREGAIAALLLAENRYEEGIAALDRAIARGGSDQDELRAERGVAMETFGRQDEALAAFDEALARNPLSVAALCGRARLVKLTPADPSIAAMEALLEPQSGETYGARMQLHFALGKAYLDLGDAASAFHHFNESRRMRRAASPYNADATEKGFAAIAAAFTPSLLERLSGQGARSPAPIFIIGMPRSGTTLIEQILAGHPAVQGAGEIKLMPRLVEQIGDLAANVASFDSETLKRLGEAYLSRLSTLAAGKPRVVDKFMENFVNAGLIRLILPNAKLIHVRRDPVDVCLSCYTNPLGTLRSYAFDQTDLGRYCRDYLQLMEHWRAVLPASHFLEVDYEAVVDDVEGQTRRMLEFLELPWDPACLDFHRVERPVRTASVNQVRKPIYRSSSGRWREYVDYIQPLLRALAIEDA
jgi:tetratricopeptide (TPR) repeat protein